MSAVPPKFSSLNTRIAIGMLTFVAAAGAAFVYFFNPSSHGFYPICQFHRITGLNCPGCGMTRSLYALLHGRFAVAAQDNVLLVGGIFLTTARGGWFALRKISGRPNGEFFPTYYLWPILAVMLVFTILRNLPAFAFLSPG